MISAELISEVKKQVAIDWHGIHGIRHWARVLENGLYLAGINGANTEVVQHFALFHDSCRLGEGSDPDHGPRGALLARQLYSKGLVQLQAQELDLLVTACKYHTLSDCHDDVTVRTCFDADRLDLGRVGIYPDRWLLCTEEAKKVETIKWAFAQSKSPQLPRNILSLAAP